MGQGPTATTERVPSASEAERKRAAWHERASALYEELRRPAAGLIRRAYGSTLGEAELEDIYSGAWLGTLRALERKQSELTDEEIRSYLLTAVANQARKELRRRRRKPVAPLEAARSVPEEAATPEELVQAAEASALTRDLLSSLPPRRRAVMLLRYGWELAPEEVCGMVAGLTPRAYRKEITRGVDELAERLKLVEEGRWCEQREPVLKALASGMATEDQALQAESHISHCRSCADFVGRLSRHLHDLGSALFLPGALEGIDGHAALVDRARDALDGLRETAAGPFARADVGEGMALAAGARGSGVAGAGALAKLSGLGAGAKAALACAGGAVAASACVAAVGPISFSGNSGETVDTPRKATPPIARLELEDVRPEEDGPEAVSSEPAPVSDSPRQAPEEAVPVAAAAPLAPDTPPVTQELGVESGATPVGQPPPQADPGSGGGAVAGEFGP